LWVQIARPFSDEAEYQSLEPSLCERLSDL